MLRKQHPNLRDAYFTDPRVAKALIKILNRSLSFKKLNTIVEPSAGNGSFYNNIPDGSYDIIGIDINPKQNNIIKHNFLTWRYSAMNNDRSKTLCIGNPPFGRQGALAKQFVDRCSEFSDHIAFVLPTSYKSIPTGFEEILTIPLDDDIFVDPKGNKFEQSIKTKFVYYQNTGRQADAKRTVYSNGLWELKRKTSSYERRLSDFRVVRASGTPGRAISKHHPDFKINGDTYNDYYVEILSPIRKYVPDIVDDINRYQSQKKWIFNNTTTFKSIDKPQLTKVLNRITSKYAK